MSQGDMDMVLSSGLGGIAGENSQSGGAIDSTMAMALDRVES